MPIGTVQGVDPVAGTVSVVVQGASGTYEIPRVRLMEDRPVPEHGTDILVLKEGKSFFYFGKPMPITAEAEEARAADNTVAGDEVIGDPEGAHVRLRKGGMIEAMANKVTGFVGNAATGICQILGKVISIDTIYFHKLIRTQGKNTKVDVRVAGSPYATDLLVVPVALEMLKYAFNTKDGKLEIDLSALSEITARCLINPLSTRVTGPDINLKLQTPLGEAVVSISGTTGNIQLSAPGVIKVDATTVLVNSDGNPLDMVRTAKDICHYTQAPCLGGSPKLLVGGGP